MIWRDCINYLGKIPIFNTNHVTIQVSFHFLAVRASFEHQPLLTELSMGSFSGIPLHDCYTEHGLLRLFVGTFKSKGLFIEETKTRHCSISPHITSDKVSLPPVNKMKKILWIPSNPPTQNKRKHRPGKKDTPHCSRPSCTHAIDTPSCIIDSVL